jgi:argininosuccinate synthase
MFPAYVEIEFEQGIPVRVDGKVSVNTEILEYL